MDNLPSHQMAGARQAITGARALLLCLPSYSPDLSPIERAFVKLEALVRRAATRTLEERRQGIAANLVQFSPEERRNSSTFAGYASHQA